MSLFGSKKKEIKTDAPKADKVVKSATAVSKAPKMSAPVKTSVKTLKVSKPVSKAVAITSEKSVGTANSSTSIFNVTGVILRPRITEKSGLLSQGGVYTFEVTTGANKNSVAQAVKTLYKVVPVKIAMLNNPARNVFVRGRRGVVPGVRKALVTLKKGDKIDFV